MHNLDRVMLEMNEEQLESYEEHENAEAYGESAEAYGEAYGENAEAYGEAYGESAEAYGESAEAYGEAYGESAEAYGEIGLSEEEVLELAAELLEVRDEAGVDRFFGKMFKTIGRGLSKFAKSGVGRAIGGFLKGAAKTVLPIAGRAIGGMFGGPLGAKLGGALGDMGSKLVSGKRVGLKDIPGVSNIPGLGQAASAFGLEVAGMSEEDQRFEVAQQFVRFAGNAIQRSMELNEQSEVGEQNPMHVARTAFQEAAQRYAPGFVAGGVARGHEAPGAPARRDRPLARTGRWVRQGSRIILFGL